MKKLLSLLLSGVILASSIPLSTYAAVAGDTKASASVGSAGVVAPTAAGADYVVDPVVIRKDDPVSSASNPTNEQLESAIQAVKAKIAVPAEYSEFNYYFYNTSSYADSYWSLTWSNPTDGSQIQVNCDQGNHITYYSINDSSSYKNSGIPVYLKKELKSKADDFIKKIAPEIFSKLEFVDANYEGIYSGNYEYSYQRSENGVAFPDNTVTVWVNSVTGDVRSASVNWLYDTKVPSSTVKLTKEEAAKIIKDNMKMNLVYRSDYYRVYDAKGNSSTKAFLVYEPSQMYISIDANTGEVYLTRTEWVDNSSRDGNKEDAGTGMAANDSAAPAAAQQPLTEEEMKKVEELKNLISKDAAIKAVTGNKYLYLESTLKAYTATLSKVSDGSGEDSYVWNVSLSDPRAVDYTKDTDTYRAYANAQVDAKTGKILSYYASIKSQYDGKSGKWNEVKVPYNKEECQTTLEKFLSSQAKSRFDNSKLSETDDGYVVYYKADNTPVYGGYNYHYNRVNQGIEYPYNGINGSVDGVTGKIYSFGCNWNDNVVFESPAGAMSADEAIDKYLAKDGYGLKYEINVIQSYDPDNAKQEPLIDITNAYNVNYEVRLVYRPDVNPYYISPFTGDQLTSSGEVYKETKPYTYLDVPETQENREILLLADMNVGFDGDYFYPNNNITNGEFNDILQKVGYGYSNDNDTADAGKYITREEMAYDFISKLGLEKISGLAGIYKTGFTDESSIDQKYLGAVALAKGLGLMNAGSDNKFNPKDNVTRAQAIHLILQYIDVQQKGVIY